MSTSAPKVVRGDRSPLTANVQRGHLVELSLDLQKRLGCVVNQDVFLECPYAYVSRSLLLDVSREAALQHLAEKINAYDVPEILVGYARSRDGSAADFVVCLDRETTEAYLRFNRAVTKNLLQIVQDEVRKGTKSSSEDPRISSAEHGAASRAPLIEIDLSIPCKELCRRKRLTDRLTVRDGTVQLIPQHEVFINVPFVTVEKSCQTNLDGRDADVQTYPGNPKNKSTQYHIEISPEFLDIWTIPEVSEEVSGEDSSTAETSRHNSCVSKEVAEVDLKQQEYKRREWEKLTNFLKIKGDEIVDAVSMNAATNFYMNDVTELGNGRASPVYLEPYREYTEITSLIDLKTVGDRYLFSATWHYRLDHLLACTYMTKTADFPSVLVLWSVLDPLRPIIRIDCNDKVTTISFCPLVNYSDILIGGCSNGKIVIWEVIEYLIDGNSASRGDDVQVVEAKIAESGEKGQKASITYVQWLPDWCRMGLDGNYQMIPTPEEQRAYFCTASCDGTILFWTLPKCLTTPAKIRSPLHSTIAPIYQLYIEEESKQISITCFCLPLASKWEENSNLERLRRVFIGTINGEVICCSWDSQTLNLDPTDSEVCSILTRCPVHDGLVRTMSKSPHFDDVLLTVGGSVFAIWKDDLNECPVYHRRSKQSVVYGEGCWSGKSGMFLLTRLDGCLELWDLKRRSSEPVLVQTISSQRSGYIYVSPPSSKLLAILDGRSMIRIFVESDQSWANEDLERIEWFKEFTWRECKRKLEFMHWQDDYLRNDPVALRRKAEREQAEADRKHEAARQQFLKEQEILAREEAEKKLAMRRVSKSLVWRRQEQMRAEAILLKKKGFVPTELEEQRRPLVILEEQRAARSRTIAKELERADEILQECLNTEIKKLRCNEDKRKAIETRELKFVEFVRKTNAEHERDYQEIRAELVDEIRMQPYRPKFDWREAMIARTKNRDFDKAR